MFPQPTSSTHLPPTRSRTPEPQHTHGPTHTWVPSRSCIYKHLTPHTLLNTHTPAHLPHTHLRPPPPPPPHPTHTAGRPRPVAAHQRVHGQAQNRAPHARHLWRGHTPQRAFGEPGAPGAAAPHPSGGGQACMRSSVQRLAGRGPVLACATECSRSQLRSACPLPPACLQDVSIGVTPFHHIHGLAHSECGGGGARWRQRAIPAAGRQQQAQQGSSGIGGGGRGIGCTGALRVSSATAASLLRCEPPCRPAGAAGRGRRRHPAQQGQVRPGHLLAGSCAVRRYLCHHRAHHPAAAAGPRCW